MGGSRGRRAREREHEHEHGQYDACQITREERNDAIRRYEYGNNLAEIPVEVKIPVLRCSAGILPLLDCPLGVSLLI